MDNKKRNSQFTEAYGKEALYLAMALLFMVSLGLVCFGCQKSPVEALNDYFGWKDDNVIEEVAEDIIDHETGVNIDVTPRSPENK